MAESYSLDAVRNQFMGFQLLAPGNHMSACHQSYFFRRLDPHEPGKFFHIVFIGPPGFLIGDIGEPFQCRTALEIEPPSIHDLRL